VFALSHNELSFKNLPKGNIVSGEELTEKQILSEKFPIQIEKLEREHGEGVCSLLFFGR